MRVRVPETDEGIQGELEVSDYDIMQRWLRDRGWIETDEIIASGIDSGHALEIGPGPGYLGLEWLRKTSETRLTGVEISMNMIEIARKNAADYGLADRVEYVSGNALDLPFESGIFDAVFTNGSLHEWERPEAVFDGIARALKPKGRFFISDLRRDTSRLLQWFFLAATKPKTMRAGFRSSLNASYTKEELEEIINRSRLSGASVRRTFIGLAVSGSRVREVTKNQ